ncbi:MAG TPA: TonB-dependent receptor [Bryobacteraceae bacterium]|nr:TonB-dependent receptor [Bryobacteraceae bacterium]
MAQRHRAVLVFCLSLAFATFAAAQVRTDGDIRGTVFDPSGTVVPNASVTLKDAATGIAKSAQSNKEGSFIFLNLLPGKYNVTVSATGFQNAAFDAVVVETGRTTDLPVHLSLGSVQQTVEVSGAPTPLDTTSNQIADTVRNDYVQNLPLAGRDTLPFALLSAGATTTSAGASTFNGLPEPSLNISLDGINNNDQRYKSGSKGFSEKAPLRLDAIDEVTVATTGTEADAAANGAMQIRFTTKRGTSQYHGKVFEEFRNDDLNANAFFNNARGLPITKVRLNDVGGNLGGPLPIPVSFLRHKLFFFVNYEDTPAPNSFISTVNVLTPAAQSGIFTYIGSDGLQHSANLLQIAGAAGYSSAIDSTVAGVLNTINGTVSKGVVRPATGDPNHNTLQWNQSGGTRDYYPTARLDYQITSKIAWFGAWNLHHYHNDGNGPAYPGFGLNSGEAKSTSYIASNGLDWTISPQIFNSFKFGVQSSISGTNIRNSVYQWASQGNEQISFGSGVNPLIPNSTPSLSNTPVYNLSDELNWVKGKHTFKFGGSMLYTRFWDSSDYQYDGIYQYSLGVATGDPIQSALSASTLPQIRSQDLTTAWALYATLTGRLSRVRAFNNLDEKAHQYLPYSPLTYRENFTTSGAYFQDSFRLTPHLTLNYGLRWQFTGAMHNSNNTYINPQYSQLLGPSTALFQPGVLGGTMTPMLYQRSTTYSPDRVNPAPNFGFAWNPSVSGGILGKLLGSTGKTVIRGSTGINYFDQGLQTDFWINTNAGNWQQLLLQPGNPGFAPGQLSLNSPLPPFMTAPASFNPPFDETQFAFANYNVGTTKPNLRTPYVESWNFGIQRELAHNLVLETRYVGNRTVHNWHLYSEQETNIFENGFLQEFLNAQNNYAINQASGVSSFQNLGRPGQVALPIFEAAFGASGSQPALAASSGFTSGTFINDLKQGAAGAAATTLTGSSSSIYYCRLVGNRFSPCSALGFNAPGNYPINFFQANPYVGDLTVTDDNSWSTYNALQVTLRKSYSYGLTVNANYTWSHNLSDSFAIVDNLTDYYTTLRNRNLDKAPTPFDIRQTFQTYWTYELPIGKGKMLPVSNGILDRIVGGWSLSGITRWNSGNVYKLTGGYSTFTGFSDSTSDSGVVLTGIGISQLQNELRQFSPGPSQNLYSAAPALIGPDGRANPAYLSPASTPGALGQFLYIYGPHLITTDMELRKETRITERLRFNFQAEFLNVFNHPVFAPGTGNIQSTSFGQSSSTLVGPRNIQLRAYLSW